MNYLILVVLLGMQLSESRADCCGNDFSRIDTHSHFVPPVWRTASILYGYGQPDGMPGIPVSSKRINLSIAILS